MKPITFDMTPLAKALEMPTAKPNAAPAATREKRPNLDRVGIFPKHFARNAGWITMLAHEQVHALATHVLARHTEHGMRSVALTSALAGEGKTTVTLALAEKLASADKRVLIIDLDTHRGTLTRAAQLETVSGALETSVQKSGSQAFHCYATDCKGVSIMPTGRVDARADGVPLLSPDHILNLTKRALEEHDIVLLDCPPLLPVADTHVIADVADSSILVVRAESTPRELLSLALKEFGKDKFFAVVLNRARPNNIPYFHEVYGYYRRPAPKPE